MIKKNNELTVVFMGTPDFAVPALRALNKNNFNVKLVVTQPDRPKGRGRKTEYSPVKTAAQKMGYTIFQPSSVRTEEFAEKIRKINPDIMVVVAFGHILTKELLGLPKLGTMNIHASLLPEYRGPAPVQWSIINGDKKTGVTIMLMDDGIDTGDILLSETTQIRADDTAETLAKRLSLMGADMLIETIKSLASNKITQVPQDHKKSTYAPLFKKKDGHIDWNMPSQKIEAFIRGVTPWPGAFTFYSKKRLKIFKTVPVQIDCDDTPGTVMKSFPDELRIATGDGALSILEIQGASGNHLNIKEFLKGNMIPAGSVLS
jgi:methionyl-tRNA formyltransferase